MSGGWKYIQTVAGRESKPLLYLCNIVAELSIEKVLKLGHGAVRVLFVRKSSQRSVKK